MPTMSSRYDIADLLSLVVKEGAEGLNLCEGKPPEIRLRNEVHVVEGPPITADNAESALRRMTSSRHMRGFRDRGELRFSFKCESFAHESGSTFQVIAKKEAGVIALEFTYDPRPS